MKSTSVTEHERRRLASVASEYEHRGYKVKLQPAEGDIPDFLTGFEPDLIATGNGESVVVEVRPEKSCPETSNPSAQWRLPFKIGPGGGSNW